MSTTKQTKSIPGPDTIVAATLSNGLNVYIYENHVVPAVVIDGSLRVGSVDEPAELGGLAALTALFMRRGTHQHTFEELNEAIETLGAAVELSGGRHAMDVFANCLSEDLDTILNYIAEMLREPSLPDKEFERLKQQTLTHLQERRQDTRTMAFLTFRRLLYGREHPYGRSVTGEVETVQRITSDHCRDFYRHHVGAEGGQIVIVGDVRPEALLSTLDRLLGDWEGQVHETPIPPVRLLQTVKREHVTIPDKSQSDLVLGWLGVPRRHPDWTPLVVANVLWGRFGMGGRIGERVREKQGLAYYTYGNVDGNFGPGTWNASAGVAPENIQVAVESILDEARRLREELVTDRELEDTQSFILGSMPVRLETNEGIASAIADMVWYDLGLDYLLQLEARVRSVTRQDIQRVARTYMDMKAYVLATAGP